MKEFTFVVTDKNGLHARPAGTIASCAKKYKSDIKIYKDEKEADAKRLLSVMSLGATNGARLIFKLDGEDEDNAQKELLKLLQILEKEG